MGTAERGKRQEERVNMERNTLGMKKTLPIYLKIYLKRDTMKYLD